MTPQLKCPYCESSDHRVILWDIRNWIRLLGELCVMCIEVVLMAWFEFEGLSLHRRCRKCGKRFLGRWKLQRSYDECPACGYNLTGNVSGHCSECGWKLPRRYRAHRKKVDRRP